MPSPAPEPLAPRPLTVWLVNPIDDVPGEGLPPLRSWTLARILADRGHDVVWWSGTWSHRRQAVRTLPPGLREDEGFSVRLVATRPYEKNISLARLRSDREFGRTFERLANEAIAAGQLERPDIIVAGLPPLEGAEAALRLARRIDATLVVDVQGLWPETCERLVPGPAFIRGPLTKLLFGGLRRRRSDLIAAADGMAAAARTYADAVLRHVPSDRPRHVCYIGAYVEEFPPPPRLIDAVPPASEITPASSAAPPLRCVCAASTDAGQDLQTLVAAARGLSAANTRAVIHVVASGPVQPLIRAAAASLRGSCDVQVHDSLTRTEYVGLLADCDVGLVIAKPDPPAAVPDEACDYAAAGLALVHSLTGELAGLIEAYEAGAAYPAGDGVALARALATLAGDRRRLLAFRHASRRLAAVEFDRERTYPRFADWLETLTG